MVSYRSEDFPAFYCVTSGIRSPHRIDDAAVLARAIECHWALGNRSSFLVTTPVREEDAIDSAAVEAAIQEATAAASGTASEGRRSRGT